MNLEIKRQWDEPTFITRHQEVSGGIEIFILLNFVYNNERWLIFIKNIKKLGMLNQVLLFSTNPFSKKQKGGCKAKV